LLVILADDLGFSDLGCYGGEIPTPNLDALAARGTRLSSFYTTPRCSPTRASLITGRQSHEVGIGVLTRPVGYRGSIDPDVPTIATVLRDAGYATSLTGKWHLAADVTEPNASWPTRRGFEDFYGILGGGTSYFNPQAFYAGEKPISVPAADDEFYLTDALTAHAKEFTAKAVDLGDPFFLYLAYTAPHWPLQAPKHEIDEQHGRYAQGWDALRTARHERQDDLGLFPEPVALTPRDAGEPAWDDAADRDWQQSRMEVYAAQVAALDRNVGELLEHLDELGVRDNTFVLFLSDNGAEAWELARGKFLAPHVTPNTTRAGDPVEIGNASDIAPGGEATFTSYGRPWANVSMTPFRLYKTWVHEGGIAAPLICSWPAGRLTQDRVQHQPQHVVDLLPTALDALGVAAPQHLAGESFLDALRDDSPDTAASDRALCWEHIGNAAVRRGRYKLVREQGEPWELYDVLTDRAELTNLAGEHPEVVTDLAEVWETWARNHGVQPWPDVVNAYVERGLPAWQARS
jgi:arylsulfatase